jgi:hypothetical protein
MQIGAALVRAVALRYAASVLSRSNIAMRAPAGTRERVRQSMSCARSLLSSKPASSCTRV